MKAWLISFTYDYYCQGWEDATTTMLVYALSFDEACNKIFHSTEFENPRRFENRTIL